MTEEDAEKCHVAGYSCQLCRPAEALPPHLAMQTPEEREQALKPVSPPPSPEYPVYGGFYNNASYMLDGTMLSERGMQHLKSLTIEKDRVRRKRRLGPDMFNSLDPLGGSHDNSLEGDDDDDDDDKPMPSTAVLSHHKDGDVVRPLADGSAPDLRKGSPLWLKTMGLWFFGRSGTEISRKWVSEVSWLKQEPQRRATRRNPQRMTRKSAQFGDPRRTRS